MRESVIVEVVSDYYIRESCLITTEVPFLQRRIDIVAYNPAINYLIAVEAKINDWRRALRQSLTCSLFADEVYIAMPEQFVHRVDLAEISKFGIGLISVNSKAEILLQANKTNKSVDYYHNWVIDRLTGM